MLRSRWVVLDLSGRERLLDPFLGPAFAPIPPAGGFCGCRCSFCFLFFSQAQSWFRFFWLLSFRAIDVVFAWILSFSTRVRPWFLCREAFSRGHGRLARSKIRVSQWLSPVRNTGERGRTWAIHSHKTVRHSQACFFLRSL